MTRLTPNVNIRSSSLLPNQPLLYLASRAPSLSYSFMSSKVSKAEKGEIRWQKTGNVRYVNGPDVYRLFGIKANAGALRARFRVIVALSHSSDTRCVVYVFILRIYVRISIPEAAKVCLRKLQAVLVQLAWRTRMYLYGGAG